MVNEGKIPSFKNVNKKIPYEKIDVSGNESLLRDVKSSKLLVALKLC